ncbi:MAG: hypothetical protein ACFE8M_11040 [Candidatus Hermodarchaeota archaeon]
MTAAYFFEKFKTTKKKTLFKLFIFAVIEFMCINLHYIISGVTGGLEWTVERLTTTIEGIFIQIINLVGIITGFLIAIYIIMFLLLLAKGSE